MNRRGTRVDLAAPRPVLALVADALRLYAARPLLFFVLALAVVAPYELIVYAVTGIVPLSTRTVAPATAVELLIVEFVLIVPLVSALHVRSVLDLSVGQRPRLGQVAWEGARALPVVAAAQIMAGIGIGLGLLVFVLPGVLLAVRWSVVAQAAAVEGTHWLGALRRSAWLTRGNGWHVFGILVVTGVVTYGVTLAGEAAIGSHGGAGPLAASILLDTLTRSFTALTTAVLYFELRGRANEAPRPR